ncbi:GNAT family N-acetyltransferase [Fictibacillus sp. FJAT-27399]|uniref:GNAT family N-acetyltransferase n=1 Tax=Fictibacillus sp. FJAT-27399 TaxID=1729689 RepID=UPI0007829C7A|nr:GNAT family N-acetyltransferase [Fictibacillus sp. FJAT-27399]
MYGGENMELEQFSEIKDFYKSAESFLMKHEAAAELITSSCLAHMEVKASSSNPPFLCCIREGGDILLTAFMNPPRPLLIFGKEEALPLLIKKLAMQDWGISKLTAPAKPARAFAEMWLRETGNSHRISMRMMLYRLERLTAFTPTLGRMRQASLKDSELAGKWLYEMGSETRSLLTEQEAMQTARQKIQEKRVYIWDSDQPVSMAAITRPTKNGMTVNMVYTPPEHRRKGFAKSCIAGLSRELLQSGRKFCTIYTDETNPSSSKIYSDIGYEEIGRYTELAFNQK